MKPTSRSRNLFTALCSRYLSSVAAAYEAQEDGTSSSFTFEDKGKDKDDSIYVKSPNSAPKIETASSVTMPMSFMTGSIVGKRFYKKVTTRESDDGVGCLLYCDMYVSFMVKQNGLPFNLIPTILYLAASIGV
ncbi:hypothetical protein SLEP1_g58970 [Rubroshorea leprosula]|uniref:Uncharacterized protein n=1 Tax=Rubroshorea leprosula TaxID=152421 RepID=A0AAV5MS23_9ROSI|nr:hypothetical protein SLEP1_g58970 [Rubroshorea leprosula]